LLSSNPSFQVYPNPSRGEIKINGITNNTQLEIFDLKGSLMKKELINENNIIDVSNLRNGIYFIKLRTNTDLIFTQKLIIEN
jgi:gingipain R